MAKARRKKSGSTRKAVRTRRTGAARIPLAQIPAICDYDCPAAAFPPAETAGICRTMSAVWCGMLNELTHKNRPCEYRKREATPATT